MQICRTVSEMREFLRPLRRAGESIGLVPTMGYLHSGHLSLAAEARSTCDATVVSIFVNPRQFGAGEDFERYPRNPAHDFNYCEEAGVDAVFCPEVEEMYPRGYLTVIDLPGTITQVMCGASRPGHFCGVATVVAKLLNIVQPDRVFFGHKDAQQAGVIQRMVEDLNFPGEIVIMPTVREVDGLALSSRNVYLSPQEREAALAIPRALDRARELVDGGERRVDAIKNVVVDTLIREPLLEIEYADIRRAGTWEEVEVVERDVLLAIAVRVGSTRLIDNTVLG